MRDNASRFGAIALVLAFLVMSVMLSPVFETRHLLVYTDSGLFVGAVLAGAFGPAGSFWRRLERPAALVAIAIAFLYNSLRLVAILEALLATPQNLKALPLLHSAVAMWFGNILVFTLAYWLIDAGGPQDREEGKTAYPDFDFPARAEPGKVRPGWRPTIIDYLFLGFTTNTAFGPTEAMPLTARTKILFMVQSLVSLITIAGIAARAIGTTTQ